MSAYENAPSTVLLATHCCACGRALRDAVSVEAGMGPDCREKHGYDDEPQSPPRWDEAMMLLDDVVAVRDVNPTMTPHKASNVLVHRAACAPRSERGPFVRAIAALGFVKLSIALAEAAGEFVAINDAQENGKAKLALRMGRFDETFKTALYNARIGVHWNREARCYMVPTDERAKRGLWAVLKAHYAGALLVVNNGAPSTIPAAAAR